jgi:hypothetical protein
MAEFYCDISAIGNEYQAYAATPTWGALSTDKPLPMDGTGLAGPSHSAAVAIAEFQITVLPADGNTIAIAGATLTAKTTAAAKNQWTISGAISTCITNLRDLINTYGTGTAQCDAVTPTTVSRLQLALPYWCFARVKPGTTDTLQIATRLAGADLNYASNSNVAITSSGWGTPPTITNFAGGANGPFAYLIDNNTVFGKTLMTYGLLFAAAPGPSLADATAPDVIHVRTERSGSNLSYAFVNSASFVVTFVSRNYLFDNGTIWSGDNGKLTLSVKYTAAGTNTPYMAVAASPYTLVFESREAYNFEFQISCTASAASTLTMFKFTSGTSNQLAFLKCRAIESSDNLGIVYTVWDGGSTDIPFNVDLANSFIQSRTTTKMLVAATGACNWTYSWRRVKANGLTYEQVSASGPIGAPIKMDTTTFNGSVEWIGGEVRDSNGVYLCAQPVSVSASLTVNLPMDIVIDGVAGVTGPSAGFTPAAKGRGRLWWNQTEGTYAGFRLDTHQFTVDWKNDGTFPHCGAANLQGVSWSHRVTWPSTPTYYEAVTPIRLAYFYRAAAAAVTITLEMYVPDATTFYQDELELCVSYYDSTSVLRTESTVISRLQQLMSSRSALASSAKSWTSNGVASYSAKKITLTTAYSVKQNTDILVRLGLAKSRGSAVTFFVSPEIGIT